MDNAGGPGDAPNFPPPAGPASVPSQFANSDPDKAQLIMQVLQLTDAQIAMLPAEQQASILELKKFAVQICTSNQFGLFLT